MVDNISIISPRKNLFDLQLNHNVAQVSNLFHKEVKLIYAEPSHGDIKHSFANIDLLNEKFYYLPNIDFIKRFNGIN